MTTRTTRRLSSPSTTRAVGVVGAGALAVLLAGCVPVPSLHPLFTEQESLFDPRLLGDWEDPSYFTLHFERSGEKRYRVTFKDEDDDDDVTYRFHGCLARLGDFLFLDVEPEAPDKEYLATQNPVPHLLPLHTFYRIELEGDVLRLAFLDDDWLKKKIEGGEIRIPHETVKDDILLTATTEELQEFVLRYAEDEEVFPALELLYRYRVPSEGN